MTKKKTAETGFVNVRIRKEVAELIRQHKRESGVMLGYFVEQAVVEKLKKAKK
jgi:predicted HicB family RNase H-like nuclease